MWCPKCRNEYRQGITVCADCGCPLVESLEEYDREQTRKAADEENAALKSQQEAQAADYTVDHEQNTEVEAPSDESLSADDSGSISNHTVTRSNVHKHAEVYKNSNEKAEENKSSAYALFGVGTAGLILIVLLFFNKLPFFQMNGSNRYFICSVMGVMFILFIVMGVVSMKSFKRLKAEAASEHSIEEEIRKWCDANLNADEIDTSLSEDSVDENNRPDGDELVYFLRTAVIRDRIEKQFVGLDEAFLDHVVDDYYSALFGEADLSFETADESDEDID